MKDDVRKIIDRLEAVQCIVSMKCDKMDAHCAYEELDNILKDLPTLIDTNYYPKDMEVTIECPNNHKWLADMGRTCDCNESGHTTKILVNIYVIVKLVKELAT